MSLPYKTQEKKLSNANILIWNCRLFITGANNVLYLDITLLNEETRSHLVISPQTCFPNNNNLEQ